MVKVRTPKEVALAKLRADFLDAIRSTKIHPNKPETYNFHPYQSCPIKFSDGYIGSLKNYRIDADNRQVVFDVYDPKKIQMVL
mgnify:FL=1